MNYKIIAASVSFAASTPVTHLHTLYKKALHTHNFEPLISKLSEWLKDSDPAKQSLAKLTFTALYDQQLQLRPQIITLLPEIADMNRPQYMDKLIIHLLPKTEFHVHLDGSIRPETMISICEQTQTPLPAAPETIQKAMRIQEDRVQDWVAFEKCFNVANIALQTEFGLKQAAKDLVRQAHQDGLIYIEPRFAPVLHTQKGLSYNQIVDAIVAGLREGREKYGIETGLTLAIYRSQNTKENNFGFKQIHQTAKAVVAAARRHPDIQFGIDIVGLETGYPPEKYLFRKAYEYVLQRRNTKDIPYIHTIAHAGEMPDTGNNVKTAYDLYKAERIGHGVHADLKTLPEDFKKNVIFEVCPKSNYQLHCVTDFDHHPIYQLNEKGFRFTINTDNRTVSNTTVTDELHNMLYRNPNFDLYKDRHFSPMIHNIITDGIQGAYLSQDKKQNLMDAAKQHLSELDAFLGALHITR